MEPFYSTTGISSGMGRDGAAEIAGSDLRLELSLPNAPGHGTNPEQLFAMGYAACFHSAMKAIGSKRKLSTKDSTVAATVALNGTLEQGLTLSVKLAVNLPALEADDAHVLVEAAHQVCPYSHATRGNIPVELELV
jgi:Ohr subfamily peroxiredoxin